MAETIAGRRSLSSMATLTTEEKLDEALRQTFPASDAFSLTPAGEKDSKLVEQRADKKPPESGA